jgi:hypothetical protein
MTDAKYDVLGIGNAIFDVLVQTDEGFLKRHGMTKGGMALIDEARATAIYRDMGPATEMSGGSASPVLARAPPSSARSRPTRSALSTRTISAPPASPSRPGRPRPAPPPAAAISW